MRLLRLQRQYSRRMWLKDYVSPFGIEWVPVLQQAGLMNCEDTFKKLHENSPWTGQIHRIIRETLWKTSNAD